MKVLVYALLTLCMVPAVKGQQKKYDIFSYTAPVGFNLKEQKQRLCFEKIEGNSFCQIYVWPAQQGTNDPEANFKTDWEHFAAKPYSLTTTPEQQTEQQNGWDVVTGVSPVSKEGLSFIVTVSTFTQNSISWCAISIFNDEKYIAAIDQFLAGINADSKKFKGTAAPQQTNTTPAAGLAVANRGGITKSTTQFNDGWQAFPTDNHVQVKKGGTEVRLYYVDDQLDNARPNTTGVPEYYWNIYIAPYFRVSNPQKWSGVEYPVIYFMEGEAVNKQTGKPCYVAIKIIYEGGARPVVVIAPDQTSFRQLFPHPNDLNRMQGYNKFAITAKDVTGHWSKAGGGGVEYYNAYTGSYAGMSAISTTDEFTFNANGTYSSVHNSANTGGGGTQFAALKYKGTFTTTDWALTATNRVSGKPKKFHAQLEAVKGGFLLVLTDSDYEPLKYILYKHQ